MKQKVISTMLLLSMGATLLAGCGTTAGNGTEGGASNAGKGYQYLFMERRVSNKS